MSHSGKDETELHEVAAILAGMNSASEIHEVLQALLTPREREEIALRWKLVCMLEKGVTQRAIATALGVSLCKITRGSHELKYGPPGFRNAIRRAIGGRTARATTKLKGLKG